MRATLGISSFGIQVIDMPPNADAYPEHDHSSDGQEEVYAALRGSAEMTVDGQSFTLDPEHVIAVKAGTTRKLIAGEGIAMLIIGGMPGRSTRRRESASSRARPPRAARPGRPLQRVHDERVELRAGVALHLGERLARTCAAARTARSEVIAS